MLLQDICRRLAMQLPSQHGQLNRDGQRPAGGGTAV